MARRRKGQFPPGKEACLRLAYVFHKAGGQLSIDRAAELLGEYFGLSDEILGHHRISGWPIWKNFVQWARQHLSSEGLMEPYEVSGWGNWRLSKHGNELGRWAAAFYDDRRTDLPPWVAEYLGPVRKRIKGFLCGTSAAKPSDDELCRWVDMCYRLEMWSESVEVFRRVLKDNVSNGLYETAERQSRICEVRLSEAGCNGDDSGDPQQEAPPTVSATEVLATAPGNRSSSPRAGEMVIQGRSHWYKNAIDAMVTLLREFADRDTGFLERCSRHLEAHSRKRRYVARSLQELYPDQPGLFPYHESLPGGWLVGTNLNNERKMMIVRAAVEVAGLRFGEDVVVEF